VVAILLEKLSVLAGPASGPVVWPMAWAAALSVSWLADSPMVGPSTWSSVWLISGLGRWPSWRPAAAAADASLGLACLLLGGTLLQRIRRHPVAGQRLVALAGGLLLALGAGHAARAWPHGPGPGQPPLLQAITFLAALGGMVAGLLVGHARPEGPGAAGPDREAALAVAEREAALAVAEREQALARLADAEARFQLLVDEVEDYAIFRLDPDGRVATWSPGAERMFGYSSDESLHQDFARFHVTAEPDAPPQADARQALDRARSGAASEAEGWLRRRDGSRLRAMTRTSALWNGASQLQGYVVITRDLTGRRETRDRIEHLGRELAAKLRAQDEELLESGAMIRSIIEHAPAAVALKNLDGQFLAVNPRMEALIGRPRAEITGRDHGEVLAPEVCARLREREQRVLGLRKAEVVEEAWAHPDGSVHDYLTHTFPLVDALGHCWGVGSLSTDITDRKQADQALLQQQKMESLGLLAGGVAHDFNNLLGAMQGNLELAKLALPVGAPALQHLQVLEGLAGNAAYLVAQILTYCGQGRFHLEPVNLNGVVEEMVHLLRASISAKAMVRYDPDPGLPGIEADVSQIQQLIMNLVINASEALEGGEGAITLRTSFERLDASYIRTVYEGQELEPGPFVALEVADTGVGMTAEVRARIFDPFFTTKFTGRGLGLSAILGIVRAHRGAIRVYSEPGRGTQFKVVLPASTREVAPHPVLAEDPMDPFRGSGTVLVVEDEASLRASAVKLLNHAGFDTLQAADGVAALQLLEQHGEGIRLILMDLTMPRMGGEETYRELRRRGLRTPVILSSGFHEEMALRHFRGQGLAGFLQKPYRYNTLMKMLREALGGSPKAVDA
jgi:PAS domain S-box-containing protein